MIVAKHIGPLYRNDPVDLFRFPTPSKFLRSFFAIELLTKFDILFFGRKNT